MSVNYRAISPLFLMLYCIESTQNLDILSSFLHLILQNKYLFPKMLRNSFEFNSFHPFTFMVTHTLQDTA